MRRRQITPILAAPHQRGRIQLHWPECERGASLTHFMEEHLHGLIHLQPSGVWPYGGYGSHDPRPLLQLDHSGNIGGIPGKALSGVIADHVAVQLTSTATTHPLQVPGETLWAAVLWKVVKSATCPTLWQHQHMTPDPIPERLRIIGRLQIRLYLRLGCPCLCCAFSLTIDVTVAPFRQV